MNQKILITTLISCLWVSVISCSGEAAPKKEESIPKKYEKALVNFQSYKKLVAKVEKHRASRLISVEQFLKMAKEPNTVILDARSNFRFNRKHLKGALNLSFSDFTQDNLKGLIKTPKTRILIYCNNNFKDDPIDFASKIVGPNISKESQILGNQKPLMLALNVPTYINLYGYGYKNVYELNELVSVNDSRIIFEGTQVK